ncbi:hypothetical protein BsWGS_24813 [Bradybaena similaris]
MAMKTLVLGMTEDQHDNRSWRCSGMVAAFILLTLLINASTREQAALIRQAYNDSDSVLLLFTWAVVFGQIIAAMMVIVVETPRGDMPEKEAMMVIMFSHVGSIFLHDYLMSVGNSHSFLAVAYFHPVLALIMIWAVTSVTSVIARPYMWASMALISIGCTLVSIKLSVITNSDRASWICLLSAFTMILRNIVIRQLVSNENVAVRPRRKRVISGVVIVAGVILLTVNIFASKKWLFPSLCAVITCALSAALTYVTTQVLRSYTVPFVSLFCVWATLVEAMVLTPNGHRPDFIMFLLALCLIAVGHYLFIKDHVECATAESTPALVVAYPPKPANTHEQYTRIEFLLFAALVVGVIIFVLQPKVSQRDLNSLSYVGLDKVISRLLLLEIKEEVHVVEEQGQVQLP